MPWLLRCRRAGSLLLIPAVLLAGRAAGDEQAAEPERILATWIAESIPSHYEKPEDWGRTRRVTVGLDASGSLLKPRIRAKKKEVPHGVWKHYRVSLVDQNSPPRVGIENLQAIAPGRVRFTVLFDAPLDGWFRTRIYEHGLHLGTYTAEASAIVHVQLDCEIAVRLDSAQPVPAVVVEPVVHRTDVKLRDFRVSRISNADGPVVREVGKIVKHLLDEELQSRKLTQKLNRSLAKKKDRFRLDLADLASYPAP